MVGAIRRHWQLIAVGAVLAGIINGIVQVLEGRGRYHPAVEFAAGIVSGPLYFAIGTAMFLSTAYSGAAISERIQARRGLHPSSEPGDGLMAVSLLLGFLLTAVWAIPVLGAVSYIPVVGEQIGRMGGDD